MLTKRQEDFAQVEFALSKITEVLEAFDNEIQRLDKRIKAVERAQSTLERETKAARKVSAVGGWH